MGHVGISPEEADRSGDIIYSSMCISSFYSSIWSRKVNSLAEVN